MPAGEALEGVRLEPQRQGAQIKRGDMEFTQHAWNLTPERLAQRKELWRQYTQLGRAMILRDTLQAIYANSDRWLDQAE